MSELSRSDQSSTASVDVQAVGPLFANARLVDCKLNADEHTVTWRFGMGLLLTFDSERSHFHIGTWREEDYRS